MTVEHRLVVHFATDTRSIVVQPEDGQQDLAELLRRAGLPLNTRCGRRGLCNGCVVEVLGGELRIGDSSSRSPDGPGPRHVRACECRTVPGASAEIRIPLRSRLAHEPQIVSSFRCNVSHALEPLWQRVTVPPAPGATAYSLQALCQLVAERSARELPVSADESLATPLPTGGPAETLALEYRGDDWLLSRSTDHSRDDALGLALDIGTTTVVGLLVNLSTGAVVATASLLNGQIALGDNVVTRINLCIQDPRQIIELQEAVTAKTISPLLAQLTADAGTCGDRIRAICVAGNTTMLHLLVGADPGPLGVAPFTPRFLSYRRVPLEQLPLEQSANDVGPQISCTRPADSAPSARPARHAAVHLLPGAAAYVGADITAGVFSSGMLYRRDPCLLVDIGTNGEIVLHHGGTLVGCATAAGPAFEGAGMSCGVRAGTGAISHVRLTEEPLRAQIEVIGGGPPVGFCGTGYVDAVAQARRHGLLSPTGRMTDKARQSDLYHPLQRGRGLRLAEGRGGEPLVVSEADVASLLQAKAAIAAGILCLLNRCQLRSSDIATVYLAGGFGFHMDLDSLIGCGILPGFHRAQIEVVGNTSLAGAYLALLDAGAIEEIKRVSSLMEIVELNLEPTFTSCYIDQLYLP